LEYYATYYRHTHFEHYCTKLIKEVVMLLIMTRYAIVLYLHFGYPSFPR